MYRLILLLCLLPGPLLAQHTVVPNTAHPTEGKAVGLVVSDVAGEWGVLSHDFKTQITPTVLEGGKVCWFEAQAGNYAVIQSGPGIGLRITLVPLATVPIPPGPGPTPTPTPTPTPVPPSPPPILGTGLKVLILYETAGGLTEKQYQILTSPELSRLLTDKCSKHNGVPEWRYWDDDYTASHLSSTFANAASKELKDGYVVAQAKAAGKPWMVVSNGMAGESVPLPPDLQSATALVNKYAQ